MGPGLGAVAHAQQLGPPIPPGQILRQQNQPLPQPPPIPSVPSPGTPQTGPAPRAAPGHDRVSRCQHEATVNRVPAQQRPAYIQQCIGGG